MEVLKMLQYTHDLIEIEKDLKHMVSWMESTTALEDKTYVTGMKSSLMYTPDIHHLAIPTRSSQVNVKSAIQIYCKGWLNNDVIDFMFQELSLFDTANNSFIFISTQHLSVNSPSLSRIFWPSFRQRLEQLHQARKQAQLKGRDIHVKAFGAVITEGDHWAVMRFDFVSMKILF
ncbi:hypothetical protein BGX21_006560 [Mortierella sp. AD011]|nr:hypothetical protein BGX21_006560 [Mortierella sp. AD011]